MEKKAEKIMISLLPREVTQLVIRCDISLLKAWRIYLGIPIEEVAEKTGLAADIFADIENNENMLSEELMRIAQALGVDVDLLVDIDPIKDLPDIYC